MPNEEEVIIVGGAKKQDRTMNTTTSIKPQGVESVKTILKKYSTWAWGLLAGLPYLYSSILALGPVPERFKDAVWVMAVLGLLLSSIKQRKQA